MAEAARTGVVGRILEGSREAEMEIPVELAVADSPLRGSKGHLWEGRLRVPPIACWPGTVRSSTITHQTALTMDLFPAIVGQARAPLREGLELDGESLTTVLLKGDRLPERSRFRRTAQARAARRGPWRLPIENDRACLFNLREDLAEDQNLPSRRPDHVRELEAQLSSWEKEVTAGVE